MAHANTGDFVWYDLMALQPKEAVAFYMHVVGWTAQPLEGGMPYTMFAGSQGPLAGATELPERARTKGAPPHWRSNVCVTNVDATVRDAQALGARVLVEAADFPNVGRLAVIADPQGAVIHVFTPSHPLPLHDSTKPGEMAWHELITNDQGAAFAFYSKLFGWKKSRDFDMGAMGTYLIFNAGDKDLGEIMTAPKDKPIPPHWLYYIHVADLDAAIDRAKAKGATLINGPMEVPGGARVAQLDDPEGAGFALMGAAMIE